ncbi:uncharacterized protein V2V93DRAFT_368399 [Kockiozyma suomiensis]|uniref:uncharacterized protein n=1 Tax=Kockiozyma suomiensis TaxID=1337062 RepID=UPI003343557D
MSISRVSSLSSRVSRQVPRCRALHTSRVLFKEQNQEEEWDIQSIDTDAFLREVPFKLRALPFLYPWTPSPPEFPPYRQITGLPMRLPDGNVEITPTYTRTVPGYDEQTGNFLTRWLTRLSYNYFQVVSHFEMAQSLAPKNMYEAMLKKNKKVSPFVVFKSTISGEDVANPSREAVYERFPAALSPLVESDLGLPDDGQPKEDTIIGRLNYLLHESPRPPVSTIIPFMKSLVATEDVRDARFENLDTMREYLSYEFLRGAALAAREFVVDQVRREVQSVGNSSTFVIRRQLVDDGVVTERFAKLLDDFLAAESEGSAGTEEYQEGWQMWLDWDVKHAETKVSLIDVSMRIGDSEQSLDGLRYGRTPLEKFQTQKELDDEKKEQGGMFKAMMRSAAAFEGRMGIAKNAFMLPRLVIEKPFDGQAPIGVQYTVDVLIEAPVAVGVEQDERRELRVLGGITGGDEDGYVMRRAVVSFDSQFFPLREDDIRIYERRRARLNEALEKDVDEEEKETRVPWMTKSYLTPNLLMQDPNEIEWRVSSFPGKKKKKKKRERVMWGDRMKANTKGIQISDINYLALVMSFQEARGQKVLN